MSRIALAPDAAVQDATLVAELRLAFAAWGRRSVSILDNKAC
jgi:hypothetical protein